MINEIAVITDSHGQCASLFEAGAVKVYKKKNEDWEVIKVLPFQVDFSSGVGSVRENLRKMVEGLESCKVIVGREITGVLYNVFDTAGFKIFEAQGMPENSLDAVIGSIVQYESTCMVSKETTHTDQYPVKTTMEGNYYFNLKQFQTYNPEISSKKALLPFLRNETFHELEVICSHIPPWFEEEFDKLRLKSEAVRIDASEYRIIIYHKTCDE